MTPPPARSPLIAVVPVRSLEGAKSRLGEALDPEERRDLVVDLLGRALDALCGARTVIRVVVVSSDEAVLEVARGYGAIPLRQIRGGLNAALDEARSAAVDLGASELLVLPGDLPNVTAAAIDAAIESLPPASEAARLVAVAPDRHGRGTNALVLRPPDVVAFAFGGDSRSAHRQLALAAGATYVELSGPLSLDIDTPSDLLLARAESDRTT